MGADGSFNIDFSAGENATLKLAKVPFLRQSSGDNQYLDPAGDTALAVTATQITLDKIVRLPALRVASLPACNANTQDVVVVVSDAMPPAYRGALTGGGAVRTMAECDGTSWTAH